MLTATYNDGRGMTILVRLERYGSGWRVSGYHSHVGRGAVSFHPREKTAMMAFSELEKALVAAGWKLRVVEGKPLPPSPLRRDEQGRPLFRDAATGEYRRDLSSERPLIIPGRPMPELAAVPADAWTLDDLTKEDRDGRADA